MNYKKLLILIFFPIIVFSQQTFVPDDAFEQFLISKGWDDVLDDYVLTDNIKDVTFLSMNNKGIQDLTGIEDFTSLNEIRVIGNPLQTFDLTSNVELQYLSAGSASLTSINIAGLNKIIRIIIEGSSLTTIDLSTISDLELLTIKDNTELVSINVNGLLKLNFMSISNNDKLETVDTSTNTGLTDFYVYYCAKIDNLDFANNTSIDNIIFNELGSISNVSIKNGLNNFYLESLSNPNLTCIEVSDADYVNENWSRTKITGALRFDEYLEFKNDCDEVSTGETITITDSNFESYLESISVGNGIVGDGLVSVELTAELTELDVSFQSISDLSGVENFTSLTTLNCSGNELTSLSVSELVNLTTLDCSYNDITALDITKNTNLVNLNCSANQLSELNTLSNSLLESIICEVNSIEYLNLVNNTKLSRLVANDNSLLGISLKNGNNTLITNENFSAFANSNLTCVEVDDANYSNMNWAQIDMQTNFNENCAPVNDDCSFTVPITLGQDTPGNTISASGAATNPNCAESGVVVYDVWYSFIAPESGSMNITISAGSLVSKIALYASCTDATPLNCDEGNLSVSGLTAGQEYYLQVWLELSTSNKAKSGSGSFVLNAQDATVLSVDNFTNNAEVTVYPNPTSELLFIKNSAVINKAVLYDLAGKIYYKSNRINNTIHEFSIQNLPSGLYLLQVEDEFKNKINKKIIKQ
ncbi:MAG: T9SS type A sorting domain-containing protein [Tenacibaculum sp.]|nr:T9SS type A sorting domain-containing protein [Tenacibaculum sp.]